MDRISAPEQNRILGGIANLLRKIEQDSGPEFLPRGLDVMGLVRQLALPSAETVEKLSYGDPLFRMPTQSNIPITTDRGYLAEVLGMAPVVPAASRATTRISNEMADQLVKAITRNPEATAPRVLEETAMPFMQAVAPKSVKRSEVQAEAKSLGLPATGKTEEIQELISIVKSDPRTWTKEQYTLIRPHLAIHQDFRPGSAERAESIMQEGLRSGMVDYLDPLERGQYSFAKGLVGSDAYLFPSRALKFKSESDPHLAPGNVPLFRITPEKGQDIYEAIVQTAQRRPETGLLEPQAGAKGFNVVQPGDKVSGLTVRKDVPNMSSISASLDDYEILSGIREVPRSAFDKEYLDSLSFENLDKRTKDLAEQIKQSKEINPMIVGVDSKGAYIIEGGHRFDALMSQDTKSIPAVVVIDKSDPPTDISSLLD